MEGVVTRLEDGETFSISSSLHGANKRKRTKDIAELFAKYLKTITDLPHESCPHKNRNNNYTLRVKGLPKGILEKALAEV